MKNDANYRKHQMKDPPEKSDMRSKKTKIC